MKREDYKKINELLNSSIRGLDANTTAYINNMLKEAQKELLNKLFKCNKNVELFDVMCKEWRKLNPQEFEEVSSN